MATPCPKDGPPPQGTSYWKGDVPQALGTFARQCLKAEAEVPYGFTWTTDYEGQTVTARKDHHTWTYRNGKLLTGLCIPGITLYRQIPQGAFVPSVDPTVPDAELAWFDHPPIAWGTVLVTAGAVVLVVTGFWLALRHAGHP